MRRRRRGAGVWWVCPQKKIIFVSKIISLGGFWRSF